MKTKEKANRIELGFFGREYACAYIGLRMQPICMYTHTSSMHVHAGCMGHVHAYTRQKILAQKQKHRP